MKLLKNIFVFIGLLYNTVFADFSCIFNATKDNLFITKVVSGRWILERYILNEKNLRHSVGELQDINCSNVNDKCAIQLSPNEGFLFEDNYGYKETSEDPSIELTSNDESSRIKINLTDDSEGKSQQGVYQITQEYSGSFREVDDPNLRKWKHSCDKMIIISNESL